MTVSFWPNEFDNSCRRCNGGLVQKEDCYDSASYSKNDDGHSARRFSPEPAGQQARRPGSSERRCRVGTAVASRNIQRLRDRFGRGHTEGLLIRITRWTTDEEDDHLTATIIERPEERNALRNELQKQEETGFIRGNSVDADWPSVRLRYARQYREEGTGKRRIILGLDRPLGFVELWDASRTLDYTVTVIVLDIDENGQGAGVLAMGTKVTYDPDFQRILMEYYSTEPVRLTNVRKTG